MNDIGKRILELRNYFNLSMEKFANKICLTRGSINKMEKGINNPTEQTLMLMHHAFGVNPMWLKHGIGDMFLEFPKTELDRIAQDYDLDETDKLLLEVYLESNVEERKYIKHFLQTFAKKIEEQKKDET